MARKAPDFATPVRRILVAVLVLVLVALFLVWRIDSPRAERLRTAFVDRFVPSFEWALLPVAKAILLNLQLHHNAEEAQFDRDKHS